MSPQQEQQQESATLASSTAYYGSLSSSKQDENDQAMMTPLNDKSNKPTHRRKPSSMVLVKTPSNFVEDAKYFKDGSLPHSIVLAVVIGGVCGTAAWLYYWILDWVLEFVWHTLPQEILPWAWLHQDSQTAVLWIPLVGASMAIGVGITVTFMGEPGDLPYTIKCVHEKAYVAMDHVMPMVAASQFSIVGGGSLGPEAPLVAICAALGGYVSRSWFGQTKRNLIRKHTLMGMAGALAAFFGCPLGGSLFALEVNSRFGIEYFEHTVEALLAGEITLIVFRGLARLPIEPIWQIELIPLGAAGPLECLYGILLGLVGAGVAAVFATFHKANMKYVFAPLGLTPARTDLAIPRAVLGSVVVVGLGMLIPHTMFWGEFEFQTIATMSPASTLEHIWPTSGLLNFELTDASSALMVGIAKLIAISFTVAGGYRGGYIFPAMAAGAALGNALHLSILSFVPHQICVLSMAAAINVAITRTAIATTLILVFLSGEQNSMSAVLAASLISLFATGYMPFIQTQMSRFDLDEALFVEEDDDQGDNQQEGDQRKSRAEV